MADANAERKNYIAWKMCVCDCKCVHEWATHFIPAIFTNGIAAVAAFDAHTQTTDIQQRNCFYPFELYAPLNVNGSALNSWPNVQTMRQKYLQIVSQLY